EIFSDCRDTCGKMLWLFTARSLPLSTKTTRKSPRLTMNDSTARGLASACRVKRSIHVRPQRSDAPAAVAQKTPASDQTMIFPGAQQPADGQNLAVLHR